MLSVLLNLQSRMIGVQVRMTDALRQEEGQGLVEYALILVFVALVAIAGLTILGGKVNVLFSEIANGL
jgi:pilus assembly protein Flp/PilA